MDDSDQPQRPLFSFGPGMRAMLLIALCFACLGIYSMLVWMFDKPGGQESMTYTRISIMFQNIFLFALPALVYTNIFPPERFRFLRLNVRTSAVTILLASFILALLIFPMDLGVAAFEQMITDPELKDAIAALEKSSVEYMNLPTFGDFLLCLLASAVTPAICEEMFFRGALQQIIAERPGFQHIAIFLSAAFFTIFHVNPALMPFIFIAGLILGYSFYWTGSLRVTIMMHFLFNGTSIFLSYLAQHNEAVRLWEPGIPIIALCAALSGLLLFLLWKRSRLEHSGI